MNLKQRVLPHFGVGAVIRRLVASWFWTAFVLLLVNPEDVFSLGFLEQVSPVPMLFGFCLFFLLFSLLAIVCRRKLTDALCMLSGLLALTVSALLRSGDMTNEARFFFALSLIVVFAFVLRDVLDETQGAILGKWRAGNLSARGLMIGLGILGAVLIGVVTSLRYLRFNSPTYDFGIFAQMFHNMAESLEPLTTLERDGVLSHFSVHLSPIYYLILPFYLVFRSPLTLQIAQAVIVMSGIVPLYLLAARLGLSPKMRMLFSGLFFLYPAINMGCFFDIHENCFLVPLLLWLFYAYEAENIPLLSVFAVLTCLVKEDAAVYVLIFALYVLFSGKGKKRKLMGAGMAVLALCWFAFAVWYLERFGLGVMSDRYDNLSADASLIGVLYTAFANPALFIKELLALEWESVQYVLTLLLPLGFLPLVTGKKSRWLLLCPMLLNLISDYPYQLGLKYQYHFGISVFLLYLAVLNVKDLGSRARTYLPAMALAFSFVLYQALIFPQIGINVQGYYATREESAEMEEILSKIPSDASVNASTMLTAHLSNREYLYDADYHHKTDTDLIIIDLRHRIGDETLRQLEIASMRGYRIICETKTLRILASPDWEGAALLEEVLSAYASSGSDAWYEEYAEVKAVLACVPSDASVALSSALMAQMTDRAAVYDISTLLVPNTDLLIIDQRERLADADLDAIQKAYDAGYVLLAETKTLLILSDPDWAGKDALAMALAEYSIL